MTRVNPENDRSQFGELLESIRANDWSQPVRWVESIRSMTRVIRFGDWGE
jgi:hypothetical protein